MFYKRDHPLISLMVNSKLMSICGNTDLKSSNNTYLNIIENIIFITICLFPVIFLSFGHLFLIPILLTNPRLWRFCVWFHLWHWVVSCFLHSVFYFLLNQLCMTYLFTKGEHSLIFSTLKKSSFPKSMLLLNFPIRWYLNILNLFEYFDDVK